MKHKGAVMEYSMERMNDLMRAYDEYISSCDYIRMPEVYKVNAARKSKVDDNTAKMQSIKWLGV